MTAQGQFVGLSPALFRALVVLIVVLGGGCVDQAGPPKIDAAAIEANNRGVGLMGYFDYEGARKTFEVLATTYPDWHDVQVNLAIATLNRQQAGDEAIAMAIVTGVLERDPHHPRAQYVAGLLSLNAGASGVALAHFENVAIKDPLDAYAAYYVALCKAQLGDSAAALASYQRAIELDPYLRSAYYGAFQALQRLKRTDEALAMLEQFQRLADNPQARLAEFKYTRMGEKGAAQVVDLAPPPAKKRPEGALFGEATVLTGLPALQQAGDTGMTVVDLDGDGALDLFMPRTAQGSLLALADGQGGFRPVPAHPLSGVTAVQTALWGDFDNDGLTDAYLLRDGPNQLWRQLAPGEWQDVTQSSNTDNGEQRSVDGLMLDADHDGDLDILVANADGPIELLNNNLDGSFRVLAAARSLTAGGRPARRVQAADLDNDRDTDLLVIHDSPPNAIYLNDRLWAYRAATEPAGFIGQPLLAAVVGDLDADGSMEIYAIDGAGAVLRWQRDDRRDWQMTRLAGPGSACGAGNCRMALADIDGDGGQELVFSRADGWRVASVGDDALTPVSGGKAGKSGHWMIANLAVPEGPSVIGAYDDEAPVIWRPGPGRFPFMGLTLAGLEEAADSMRSNASGIGTRVHVRADSRWSAHTTLRNDSGPGQSLQPLYMGLAGHTAADYVALTWSDGVFQTELSLAAGQVHALTETQRQLSSCPVLFAWDGERYAFVSDLLGVGGIGFNTGFGQYAEPRPWEYFQLPEGRVKAREGQLILKIAEPMEEVAYLDSARLWAYTLPPPWKMLIDERMGLADPLPTGRPVFYREEWTPVAARNERGDDVLASVLEEDGHAAPVGDLDRRFIGRLAGEHVLGFEFAEAVTDAEGDPWLMLDGWVEYPYSQTGFAAWQAGAAFSAPSLEARNEAGEWILIAAEFGYPAGMPRRMALPLRGLPAGATHLRLRTNLEVYWDRVAVVFAEPAPGALKVEELPLRSARLEQPGFPKRTNGPQRRPDYDYERRAPLWDTRHPRGFYTAFGDATELVAGNDDALAIVGPGEALSLSFDAPAETGPPPVLVFEARGWAKDMDLYTADAGTVGPLPESGGDQRLRRALHDRYNTRFQAGF